jgi:hypothetical protein
MSQVVNIAEVDALEAVLPAVIDVHLLPAPVARPREDTAEREKNRRSNPVLDTVLDDRRLHLSQQLLRSRNLLRSAVIAVRGVRRGLEVSLNEWHGESE